MNCRADLLKSLTLHIALLAAFIAFGFQTPKLNENMQVVKISMCNIVPLSNDQDDKHVNTQSAMDTTTSNDLEVQAKQEIQKPIDNKIIESPKLNKPLIKTDKNIAKPQNNQLIQQKIASNDTPNISSEATDKTIDSADELKPCQIGIPAATPAEPNATATDMSSATTNKKTMEQKGEEKIFIMGAEDGPGFIHQVKPEYPRLARRLGKEGTVSLLLSIDENGALTAVEVLSEEGAGFKEAAIEAVKKSNFRPAINAGKNVASKARFLIVFKLEG